MPELIERGHIFIAQPPLYKASRGKSERYLKDEPELQDYLIAEGAAGAVLTCTRARPSAARIWDELVAHGRQAVAALSNFPHNIPLCAGTGGHRRRAEPRTILSDAGKAADAAKVHRPAPGHAERGV
jgi:DNA gyrase subunit B